MFHFFLIRVQAIEMQGVTTPVKSSKRRTRYDYTRIAYEERCNGIPAADDGIRIIPTKADFTAFSYVENCELILRFLVKYFSRRRQVRFGPILDIIETSDCMDCQPKGDMQSFLKAVCKKRLLGLVLGGVETRHGVGHALLIVLDAQTMRDRVNVYVIDPNGSDPFSKPFVKTIRSLFNFWNEGFVRDKHVSPHHTMHTYTLQTPNANAMYTSWNLKRDHEESLQIEDEREGMCAPWVFVYAIDVICTKHLSLTRNHFLRMYDRAGGSHESASEQRYARLMYVRSVLTWIWDHIAASRGDDGLTWLGPRPYDPATATYKIWVAKQ